MNESIFGTIDVKSIAKDANMRPPKNAKGTMRSTNGSEAKPKSTMMSATMEPLIRLFVAPQRISPAMTSSIVRGVARMASNVFW